MEANQQEVQQKTSLPTISVWNKSSIILPMACVGISIGFCMFFCQWVVEFGWDGFQIVLALALTVVLLGTLGVLLVSWLACRVPALILDREKLSGDQEIINWPQIQSLDLVQETQAKSKAPIPGNYELQIYYVPMPGSEPSVSLKHTVSLVFPSIHADTLLPILQALHARALGETNIADPLPAELAVDDGSKLEQQYDPRLRPVSKQLRRWNRVTLLWLLLATSLLAYGLSSLYCLEASPGDSNAFLASAAFDQHFVWAGWLEGILLFVALLPQLTNRVIANEDGEQNPGFTLRDLIWLPIYVCLLGYLAVNVGLPRLMNALDGTAYNALYTVTNKYYQSHRPKRPECYYIGTKELDGTNSYDFCADSGAFQSISIGTVLPISGVHSWFVSELLRYHFDPSHPPKAANTSAQ